MEKYKRFKGGAIDTTKLKIICFGELYQNKTTKTLTLHEGYDTVSGKADCIEIKPDEFIRVLSWGNPHEFAYYHIFKYFTAYIVEYFENKLKKRNKQIRFLRAKLKAINSAD